MKQVYFAQMLLTVAVSCAMVHGGTIFADDFSGSHPGSWYIGHDGGGGAYAWAWPQDYAFAYADPNGAMYYYPNNLHVYMERRFVSLAGYAYATLTFKRIVDTEAGSDFFTINVRDQSGQWHGLFSDSGPTDPLNWTTTQVDLSQFAGQTDLYVQFRFDSNATVNGPPYEGVYIDDVELTASTVPPNPPTFQSTPPNRLYPEGMYDYPSSAGGIPCPDDPSEVCPYTVTVNYTDTDGRSNIANCYLRLAQGNSEDNNRQTIMWWPGNVVAQWDDEPHRLTNLSATSINITNGYRITFSFQLTGDWNPSTDVDYYAWAFDGDSTSIYVKKNRNAIYDNDLHISGAEITSAVDLDDDDFNREVEVHVDCNSSVCPRQVINILYAKSQDTGEVYPIAETPAYSICFDDGDDSTSITARDLSYDTYDFFWELYDDTGTYLETLWFSDADILNITMETAGEDLPAGEAIWVSADDPSQGLVEQLASRNIKHIFLQMGGSQPSDHHDLVASAHAAGMTVHALIRGSIAAGAALAQDGIDGLLSYNEANPSAAYDGVQLDIESDHSDEEYLAFFAPLNPQSLVFSSALPGGDRDPAFYASLVEDTELEVVIPMIYIMDAQEYCEGEPVFNSYERIRSRTNEILAGLPSYAKMVVGLSAYDRSLKVPHGYTGSLWCAWQDCDGPPNVEPCHCVLAWGEDANGKCINPICPPTSALAFDLGNEYSVPRLVAAGHFLEWVRHYNASGVSVYRFAWDDAHHLDVVETTAEGVRRSRDSVQTVADEDPQIARVVGSCLWWYCSTFNEYDLERGKGGRDEGLLEDDQIHPEPKVCIQTVDFAGGVAMLRVQLENGNAPEGVIGADWSMGVHLRLDLDGTEAFLSADAGDFHGVHAFDESGGEIGIPGSRIIELRRSFFEDSEHQSAQSGLIRIAATGPFTLSYRGWMRDKDSTCLCEDPDGSGPLECDNIEEPPLEPYIARWPDPDDICYHHPDPLYFLQYQTATTTVGCPSDISGDSVVDREDLYLLLDAWGPCSVNDSCCPADVDGDGTVSVIDFLQLLADWGPCL